MNNPQTVKILIIDDDKYKVSIIKEVLEITLGRINTEIKSDFVIVNNEDYVGDNYISEGKSQLESEFDFVVLDWNIGEKGEDHGGKRTNSSELILIACDKEVPFIVYTTGHDELDLFIQGNIEMYPVLKDKVIKTNLSLKDTIDRLIPIFTNILESNQEGKIQGESEDSNLGG